MHVWVCLHVCVCVCVCVCVPGMGIPTVTAARILKGQLSGQSGEEFQMEMDKFPYVALSKVGACSVLILPCQSFCAHNPAMK